MGEGETRGFSLSLFFFCKCATCERKAEITMHTAATTTKKKKESKTDASAF